MSSLTDLTRTRCACQHGSVTQCRSGPYGPGPRCQCDAPGSVAVVEPEGAEQRRLPPCQADLTARRAGPRPVIEAHEQPDGPAREHRDAADAAAGSVTGRRLGTSSGLSAERGAAHGRLRATTHEPSGADTHVGGNQRHRTRQHQRGSPHKPPPAHRLPGRVPGPETFHEPHLEPERRLDTWHDLEQRVGCERELLHLGLAARACFDMGERLRALSSRRDPERELRDLLGVPTAFGPRARDVLAHRLLPSLVIVPRSFVRPARIRVFAVPRGIASLSLISAAVIP
jgi:hypothetical protein